jgi:hypothetical protein
MPVLLAVSLGLVLPRLIKEVDTQNTLIFFV